MTAPIRTAWAATALGVLLSIGATAPRLDAQPLRERSTPSPGRGGIEGDPIPLGSQDPRFQEYLTGVAKAIQSKWVFPCVPNATTRRCEHKTTTVVIEFGILKNGVLQFVEVRQGAGAGLETYDDSAVAAIKLSSPFAALPPEVVAGLHQGSTGMPVVATFRYVVHHTTFPTFPTLPSSPPVHLPRGGATTRAGVITKVDGPVVAHSAAHESPTVLRTGDELFLQDQITTGDQARADMLLGGKAAVVMRERSRVSIAESPGRSTLLLSSGLLVTSIGERLGPGESVDVRTSNAIATVRGAVRMTVEVTRADAGVATHVDIAEGSASVVMSGPAPDPAIELRANDGITITGQVVGPVRARRSKIWPP